MIFVKLSHEKNENYQKIVKQYAHHKIQMINYFTCLGQLKALYYFHNETLEEQPPGPEDNPGGLLKQKLEFRLKALRMKLEKVDVDFIRQLQSHQAKQQVFQQFYQSLGEISVIKCGIKGLDFRHIFDYFALALIRQRTHEAITLHLRNIQAKESKDDDLDGKESPKCPKLTAENYAHLMRLQKMKFIAKLFGNSGYSDSEESYISISNYEKYEDDNDGFKSMVRKCQQLQTGF